MASGAQCRIYEHPHDSSRLIKIMKLRSLPWHRRPWTRSGQMLPVVREIEEFVALAADGDDVDLVERVIGVEQTDLGIGLVVEALRDRDGGLAPTLRALIGQGRLDAPLRTEVERFIARIEASDIVVYDLRAKNVVYAYDPESQRDRFVLVDGIGERRVFPWHALLPSLNRFNKKRRIARLRSDLGPSGV